MSAFPCTRTAAPADKGAVDYAVVIIMAVFIFASISWVVSARKWFKGPVRAVDDETSSESASEDEKKSAS